MTPSTEEQPYYMDQHRTAVEAGLMSYVDSKTGFHVWTELFLKDRPCCQSACRHCPFGFKK